MKFNEKLKLLRKINNYTQKEFAFLLGCSYSTLGHYEAGRIRPTIGMIELLCDKFPQYALWLLTRHINVSSVKNQKL